MELKLNLLRIYLPTTTTDSRSAEDIVFLHLFVVFVMIYNMTVVSKYTFVLEINTYCLPEDLFIDI